MKEYAQKEGLSFESDDDFFAYQCRKGLEKRLVHIDTSKHEEYKARLEREIDIICKMKFPGYMLIVWDFIREAKERGVPVGPGRGSAAGSLVAFSLFITDIDPMPYNLLFERFLNPERISMPDIDIDFFKADVAKSSTMLLKNTAVITWRKLSPLVNF
jgi:DNA polymerase-3 subunit alpha